jgi:hypothetical protein
MSFDASLTVQGYVNKRPQVLLSDYLKVKGSRCIL